MSIERLRALEKKWRVESDRRNDLAVDMENDAPDDAGWNNGIAAGMDECADELATLIAELGQEVAPVAWGIEFNGSINYADVRRESAESEVSVYGSGAIARVVPLYTSPAHTSEARERTDDAYLGGRQEVTVYYVAEVLGGDFDNVPISMFGDPAIFSNRESAEKFCDFASMTGRKHEVRDIALNAAMRQEGGNG